MRPLLGTYVEIHVETTRPDAQDIVSDAFKHIAKIQRLLSFHDPDSDLSKLNRSYRREVSLHPLSADVLRLAMHVTGASKGYFNCTVGGALVQQGALPNHGSGPIIASGCVDDIVLDGCRATLLRPIRVTLDGIAKGYAVDQAVELLQQRGIEAGWINAGGDIRVFGDITTVIYQRRSTDKCVPLGSFSDTSIATSSADIQHDKRFPSMIFDGNGAGFKAGIWTVKACSLWLADALTKVASTAPRSTAAQHVAELGGELLFGAS